MEWFVQNYNIISVVFFLIVAFVSHLVTPPSYNWKENTISELAAQKYDNKWIMQTGLSGFGLLLGGGILVKLSQDLSVWMIELPVFVYAMSIFLSGIFCTKPFFEGENYSLQEDKAHSVFANMTGIAFSLSVTIRMVFAEFLVDFMLNTVFLFLVVVFSIAFGRATTSKGIIQRGIFTLGFVWLLLLY